MYKFSFGTKLKVIYFIIQIPKAFERYGGYYRFKDSKGIVGRIRSKFTDVKITEKGKGKEKEREGE